jgi:hypothetical protein
MISGLVNLLVAFGLSSRCRGQMHARVVGLVVGTRALPAFFRAEDVGKGVVDRGWKCERSPIRCWHVGVVLECLL